MTDLTQSYDKSPYTDKQIQNATWQNKNATKNFDYTTIADRLRTVSLGKDSHQLVWWKRLTGSEPSHSPRHLCNRGHKYAGTTLPLAEILICKVSKENKIYKDTYVK